MQMFTVCINATNSAIISSLFRYLRSLLSILLISHLSPSSKLTAPMIEASITAIQVSTTINNMVGAGIMVGINGSIDSLVAQA